MCNLDSRPLTRTEIENPLVQFYDRAPIIKSVAIIPISCRILKPLFFLVFSVVSSPSADALFLSAYMNDNLDEIEDEVVGAAVVVSPAELSVGAAAVEFLVGAAAVESSVGAAAVELLVGAAAVESSVGAAAVELLVGAAAVESSVGAAAVESSVGAAAVELLVGAAAVESSVGAAAVELLVGAAAVGVAAAGVAAVELLAFT